MTSWIDERLRLAKKNLSSPSPNRSEADLLSNLFGWRRNASLDLRTYSDWLCTFQCRYNEKDYLVGQYTCTEIYAVTDFLFSIKLIFGTIASWRNWTMKSARSRLIPPTLYMYLLPLSRNRNGASSKGRQLQVFAPQLYVFLPTWCISLVIEVPAAARQWLSVQHSMVHPAQATACSTTILRLLFMKINEDWDLWRQLNSSERFLKPFEIHLRVGLTHCRYI